MRPRRAWIVAALVMGAGLWAGCETSVDAVSGSDAAFSVFGFFNPLADTQAVRVFPVEGLLVVSGPDPLDAEVTSTELETGEQRVWRDSVVQFLDGSFGHVYWSPFRAAHERTYRLEVARSDGAASVAEVETPPEVAPGVDVPVIDFRDVTLPVRVPVEAPRLLRVEVVYYTGIALNDTLAVDRLETVIPYDDRVTLEGDGWRIPVDLSGDRDVVREAYFARNIFATAPALLGLTFRVMIVNRAWSPPGGVFDPDVLALPGLFSNVEKGLGFVGAGYPLALDILPDDEVVKQAGFSVLTR
ncbi:hypothetical protein [Rhodocaloribacter sp.]